MACRVIGGQQVGLEVRLAHRLSLCLHEQPEQIEHCARAVQVGCHGPAEDPLELFALFEERRAELRLDVKQEALVASVADQRCVAVTVGDKLQRLRSA